MRLPYIIFFIFILLANQSLFGQQQDGAVDQNQILSDEEANLLNDYFDKQRADFDFRNKKVVFVSGSTGTRFITKQKYFADIQRSIEANSEVVSSLIVLNENERIESGHYDAIVTAWVKVLTPKRRRIIIRELSSGGSL